ncbi:hypothetical protein [Sorangium sp. So ce341]|uniref:hypothetical protein n=1 Tax=Sorangium sp. So ce341 TaxID=3133302 RepID=UPI003F5EEDBA
MDEVSRSVNRVVLGAASEGTGHLGVARRRRLAIRRDPSRGTPVAQGRRWAAAGRESEETAKEDDMTSQQVVAIDTSYDADSAWFASGRALLYARLQGQFNIVPFGQTAAERRRILRYLSRTEDAGQTIRAIVVSSHGKPSRVIDDDSPDKTLLSAESPEGELALWARGRVLYFCCCEAGIGPLFDKLLDAGARTVVGFTGKPTAATTDGKFLWREFDQELVSCALHGQRASGFERAREQYMDRLERRMAGLPEGPIRQDFIAMFDVLAAMVIRDGHEV